METESVKPQALLEDAGWIRRLAGRLVQDEAAADDAAQDTLLAALRRPPRSDRPVRPWLARVLRNFVHQRARREGHRAAREELVARAEAQPSTEELVLRAERQGELVNLVIALDEPYRSTLLLRYFEGLSPAGIAELQGVRGATVRSRIQRGLTLLRNKLEARHGGRDEWVRGLAPLPVSLGPLGTSNGWDSPTLGSGAETMVSGTKLLVAAGIALVGGAATYGVIRMQADGGATVGREAAALDRAALTEPSFSPEERARSAEPLESADMIAAEAAEGRARLAPAPAAPLGGILLDEVDGLPLADFELVVRSGNAHHETVRTGSGGEFESRHAFVAGPLQLEFVDHASNRISVEKVPTRTQAGELTHDVESVPTTRHLEHELGAPTVRLEVAAGPTYPLELVTEQEIDLRGATALLRGRMLKKAGMDHAFTVLRHDSDGAWVRFGARARDQIASQRGFAVEVRDASGLWAGIGLAESTRGTHDPVRVELFEHTLLEGRVLTTEGEPVAGQELVLTVSSEKQYKLNLLAGAALEYRAHTDAHGNYHFRWVRPDAYQLALVIDGSIDFAELLTLEPGRRKHDLVVDPLDARAKLAGRVTSLSGQSSPDVLVYIERIDPLSDEHLEGVPERGRWSGRKSTRVEWEETPEGRLGSFEFEALPPGSYALKTRSNGFAELTPTKQVVTVPADVELVIQDTPAQSDFTFRVREKDGEPIRRFHTRFVFDALSATPVYREVRGERGISVVAGVPHGPEFSWRVHAPGFQPVWGDRASFAGADELELELEGGWGTVFVVHGPAQAPLAGAEVYVDGVLGGRTNSKGRLRHTQPDQPREVRITWTDGTRVYSEEFAELDEYHPVISVLFEEDGKGKR